jgi:hypothetical protein
VCCQFPFLKHQERVSLLVFHETLVEHSCISKRELSKLLGDDSAVLDNGLPIELESGSP